MPSIKDFDKKNKDTENDSADSAQSKKSNRRRPGRDSAVVEELHGAHAEEQTQQATEASSEDTSAEQAQQHAHTHFTSEDSYAEEKKKVDLTELPGVLGMGAGIIKSKAPQVVEALENVATDWVNDGNFQNIPIDQPLAQFAIGKALRSAKDVEKKLEEKGVFMMARVGIDLVKSKLNKK